VFVRGAAIRPVPAWAIVEPRALEKVEEEFAAAEEEEGEQAIDAAFERFEKTQPVLAESVNGVLSRPLDETALALGYFLTIAVWRAFEEQFPDSLDPVSKEALAATEQAFDLEEELRAKLPTEPVEAEDVVAHAQPAVIRFVNEHVEAALDTTARAEGETEDVQAEVDVDDVHLVYRTVLVLALALSHAVRPAGASSSRGDGELQA
jgi:hypothetical protein